MFTCFAVAAPGTELWVADEIRDLGFQDIVEIEGGVEFEASLKDVMRANLWSRTVSRFLVRLATFPARELSLLQRRIAKLELTSFVPKGAALRLKVTCKKSKNLPFGGGRGANCGKLGIDPWDRSCQR